MLETILEKLIITNFGEYIQGLDKSNLKIGVWSGNVVIQNVSVKPEILSKLEIPLEINFSHIGKLELKVPWASLGSKPVEVLIEDIYILLSPIYEKDWKPIDYASVGKRLDVIENFARDYLQKIMEKDKINNPNVEKAADQTMMAKMSEKILDNLQVIF